MSCMGSYDTNLDLVAAATNRWRLSGTGLRKIDPEEEVADDTPMGS